MPVKVCDEPECVAAHASELASFGKKALLVTGRSSAKKCGALDDVVSALDACGTAHCVFSDVEENPSVETVMRAAAFGRDEKADFVIGIGGGSPLDAAKAAAFLMARDVPTAESLYDSGIKTTALPVAAIPTTCGTGSEVTGVSVLTVHAKQTKISLPHKIFPEIALIDGKYLRNAPLSMIVNTSVDAFAHLAESYESRKADDYSHAVSLAGLALWGRTKDVLTGEREMTAEDRAILMRASTFAGMAIAQTGTSIPHALGYILTYDLQMPHGKASGYFLHSYLREASLEDRRAVLGAAGFDGIEEFGSFLAAAFPDISAPAETLQRAYDRVVTNDARMKGCRFPVDEEVLRRIVFET